MSDHAEPFDKADIVVKVKEPLPSEYGLLKPGQLLFTYLPVMNSAFGSRPIGLREWGLILVASFVIYIVIEFEKSLRQRVAG